MGAAGGRVPLAGRGVGQERQDRRGAAGGGRVAGCGGAEEAGAVGTVA